MSGGESVARILNASSLFARLDLSDEAVDVVVVKSQYRKLALAVHPDKCEDPRAKEAFQALSEAFEQLSSEVGQAQCLRQAGKDHRSTRQPKRSTRQPKRQRGTTEDDDRKAHWWDTRTWEEFEQRLKHRERMEAAIKKQYFTGLRVRFETSKVRGQIREAERSVEHCDRNAGLPESCMWPPESTQAARDLEAEVAKARLTEPWRGAADEALPNYAERPELNEPGIGIVRLLELMTHLRTVHLYCIHCGCRYDSAEDMEHNCPGVTEEEHDEAKSMGLTTSAETVIDQATDQEEPGEDPLEAYMASVDEELHKQDKRRKKPRRG